MKVKSDCPPHKHREEGPGWVKCLDCGAGYGWPGILDETPKRLEPDDVIYPGDVIMYVEQNEAV